MLPEIRKGTAVTRVTQPVADVIAFALGGYPYIKSLFQHLAGVAAETGFEIERARFAKPVSLAKGFAAVEDHRPAVGA
jgi:hypothetical protein